MSSLRRDLFERRLWPVAVVLLAAIVAVPFLIPGHGAGSTGTVPPPPAVALADSSAAPAAGAGHSVPAAGDRAGIRSSATRDPFAPGTRRPATKSDHPRSTTGTTPAPGTTPGSVTASSVTDTGTTVSPTPTSPTPTTSSAGSSPPPVASPTTTTMTVTTTATKTTTTPSTTPTTVQPAGAGPWKIYSVDARIGAPGRATGRSDLARLTPLPSVATPKTMFTGVLDHGHEAGFALANGVTPTGPGVCRPTRAQCSLIALKPGQSETLSYLMSAAENRTLTLAVSRITTHATSSRARALDAFQRVSRAGRCELDLANPVQYHQASGLSDLAAAKACRHTRSTVPFPGAPSRS